MQSIPDREMDHPRSSTAPNAMFFTTMGRVAADAVAEDLLQLLTGGPGPQRRRPDAAACPQLAKADKRPLNR
jgi:hypothetical protein